MSVADNVISLAKNYIGYLGKYSNKDLYSFKANANGKYNMFAYELDALGDWYNGKKNGYDWCDVFVDWLMYKSFGEDIALKVLYQPHKSLGAGVKYSAQYYKDNKAFFDKPKPGDQIFFGDKKSGTWYHTGIVTEVTSTYVNTVEGNASAKFDGKKYASAVAAFRYPLTYSTIIGYGRPNYAVVKDDGEKEPEQVDNGYDGKVTATVLNVRSGPSTKYKVVKQLKYATVVHIQEEADGWGKIGDAQWVCLQYIKKV